MSEKEPERTKDETSDRKWNATPRGRWKWGVPIGVVAVAVVAFGIQRWMYAATHETTNDAFVGGHLVPVLAKVGGFVDELRVTENQHVEKGEVLVTLDERELRQALARAEAELALARAAAGHDGRKGAAESRVDEAVSRRGALTEQIAAARAQASRADRDLERIRGLAEQEIVSRQQLDGVMAEAEATRANVASLEQQRRAAEATIATARAGVEEAEARLESAKAAVELARLQLSHARIEVPVTGTVAKLSVQPGQLLQPGQPVLTIVSEADVYVDANFKETQVAAIRPGFPVSMEVDAYGGCEAHGRIQGVGGATGSQFALIPPDNATGNFTKVVQRIPVRIDVLEDCGVESPLRPGMSVVVHVETS